MSTLQRLLLILACGCWPVIFLHSQGENEFNINLIVKNQNSEVPLNSTEPFGPRTLVHRRRHLYELALQEHYQSLLNNEHQSENRTQTLHAVSHAYRVWKRHDHASKREPLDRISSLHSAFPVFPPSLQEANRKSIREAFQHGYDAYMYNAFPAGELKPISCQPGTFDLIRLPALTLIDSLDTLLIMGNVTEFARSVERLKQLTPLFQVDQNVSLFETNIRVLGGLLSAHQLAMAYSNEQVLLSDVWSRHEIRSGRFDLKHDIRPDAGEECDQECHDSGSMQNNATTYWKYDGSLLDWALDLGHRLYPAFQTATGIPYGTVNLLYGVPQGETTEASLAGGGTLTLEMELLSRLSGQAKFGKAAKRAMRSIFVSRSAIGLWGKHIDVQTGKWKETLSGIGSNSDSFFEYLLKHYAVFQDEDFWLMFTTAYAGVSVHLSAGDWYKDADMKNPNHNKFVLESLMAFYPGLQVLLGEVAPAARSLNAFFLAREWLSFLPERFAYRGWRVDSGGGYYPLRPELLESAYYLHRATQNRDSSSWQWAQHFAWRQFEWTRTECGYASVRQVKHATNGHLDQRPPDLELADDMPSFFLSETLKYLYLTFDPDNVLHTDVDRQWVFTTEAHPIHHEPPVEENGSKESFARAQQVKDLKRIIRLRLKGKEARLSYMEGLDYLSQEMWSDTMTSTSFRADMTKVSTELMEDWQRRRRSENDGWLNLETMLEGRNESQVEPTVANRANVRLRDRGQGPWIRRACPNWNRPAQLWQQALTGGVKDYVESFVTVGQDDDVEIDYPMYGAMEALQVLGSGLYMKRFDGPHCSLENESDKVVKEEDTDLKKNVYESPLGTFEVALFGGTDGYFVRHIESGLTLNILVLNSVGPLSDVLVMTMMSSSPIGVQGEDKTGGDVTELPSWRSLGKRLLSKTRTSLLENPQDGDDDDDIDTQRKVVFSDLNGNSYQCKVELVEKSDESADEVVASIPCSPAMFGPSHIPFLVSGSEDLIVEAPIGLAPQNDVMGCPKDTEPTVSRWTGYPDFVDQSEIMGGGDTCPGSVVQMVHRGGCTFLAKALRRRSTSAPAVIIVNSDDDLFVMSVSEEEAATVNHEELPLTVMVTFSDSLLITKHTIGLKQSEDKYLAARVRLSAQLTGRRGNRYEFPLVHGRKSGLDIYSPGGWGIQVKPPEGADQGIMSWQLHLTQHALSAPP